jgi:hypothetical protein
LVRDIIQRRIVGYDVQKRFCFFERYIFTIFPQFDECFLCHVIGLFLITELVIQVVAQIFDMRLEEPGKYRILTNALQSIFFHRNPKVFCIENSSEIKNPTFMVSFFPT